MQLVKMYFFIYIIVIALIYALMRKSGVPKLVPGDIYINKAGRQIYIPVGASFILTTIIFIILYSFAF